MFALKRNLFLFILFISLTITAQNKKSVVVLELFTSQGCSSCPSANKALNKVKQTQSNVIVLSYHVDYWNYIGWKDPFSKKTYADKQRRYAQKFNSETIYTPQTVVNGDSHFVGSDTSILNEKLKTYSEIANSNTIKISNVERLNYAYSFDYTISGDVTEKQLRIVLVINERKTEVSRGENRNKTLLNTNIVVNEIYKPIQKDFKTGKSTIKIPDTVSVKDTLSLIVLVENNDKDILGGVEQNL